MTLARVVHILLLIGYGFACFYFGFREGWGARNGSRKDW